MPVNRRKQNVTAGLLFLHWKPRFPCSSCLHHRPSVCAAPQPLLNLTLLETGVWRIWTHLRRHCTRRGLHTCLLKALMNYGAPHSKWKAAPPPHLSLGLESLPLSSCRNPSRLRVLVDREPATACCTTGPGLPAQASVSRPRKNLEPAL